MQTIKKKSQKNSLWRKLSMPYFSLGLIFTA